MIGAGTNNRLLFVAALLCLMTALLWKPSQGVAEPAKTVIEIQRPASGEVRQIEVPANATLKLLFDAKQAELIVEDEDLVIWFPDGDALIVLQHLFLRRNLSAVYLVIDGETLHAGELVDRLLPAGATGGGSHPITEIDPSAGGDTGGGTSLPNLSDLRHTGRDLLFPLEIERQGHPLYSYLLFAGASREEREERARFKSAVKAFVGQVRTTEALEKSGAERASINIFYAPLKEIFEDTSPASMRLHFAQRSDEEQIEILTRLYDYARAEVLMGQLRLRGNGPFIVSVLRPLSEGAVDRDEAFLVQDLSRVPPKLVGLWIDEFKRQVVQEATDSPERLRRFALTLRTQISVLAEGFAITKSAVAEMFEAPKDEGGE